MRTLSHNPSLKSNAFCCALNNGSIMTFNFNHFYSDILKVSKLSQLKFVAIEDLAQIGLSRPEQRRYKKLYSKCFPNSYITKLKKLLNVNKKNETVRFEIINKYKFVNLNTFI